VALDVTRLANHFIAAARIQERLKTKRAARHGVAAVCAAKVAAQ
jgi:hypothetical protein